ncbi:MAG: transcriptional repressor [Phycisphaerales bacterium]|nr:transcriptional repressor [Phycisphaerales bacterium]
MERQTQQQAAIERVISRAGRPLSPAELLALARVQIPSLSLATVYRALRRLEGLGHVSRVELPGHGSRYESRAAAQTHHHHFVCHGCERVFDVPGCAPDVERLAPAGFRVESHEIVLYGRCRSCERAG